MFVIFALIPSPQLHPPAHLLFIYQILLVTRISHQVRFLTGGVDANSSFIRPKNGILWFACLEILKRRWALFTIIRYTCMFDRKLDSPAWLCMYILCMKLQRKNPMLTGGWNTLETLATLQKTRIYILSNSNLNKSGIIYALVVKNLLNLRGPDMTYNNTLVTS